MKAKFTERFGAPATGLRRSFRFFGPGLFLGSVLVYLLGIPVYSGSYSFLSWDGPSFYALAVAGKHNVAMGIDTFHAYGPLNFLFKVVAVRGGDKYVYYLLFKALLHGSIILGVFLFARRSKNYAGAALLLFVHSLFMYTHHIWDLLYPLVALVFFFEDIQRRKSKLFVVPAALAGLVLFIKFFHGVSLGLLYAVHLVASRIIKQDTWRDTALKISVYGIAVLLPAAILYKSPALFFNYCRVSLNQAQSYSIQFGLGSHPGEVLAAMIALSFIVSVALLILRTSRKTALYWLAMTLTIAFFSFKHSFVYQLANFNSFMTFLPMLVSMGVFFVPVRGMVLIIVQTAAVCCLMYSFRMHIFNPFEKLSQLDGSGMRSMLFWNKTNQAGIEENEAYFRDNPAGLSAADIEMVGHGTVSTVRSYIPYIDLAGLKWKPNPFCLYSFPMTAGLDRENASFIESNRSADYFLLTWEGRDATHPLFASPASIQALLRRYEFVSQSADYLLLRKTGELRREDKKPLGSITAAWGDAVKIPDSEKMVIAEIRAELNLKGKISKFLFRIPPTYIALTDENGESHMFRFTTTTSANGLIVSRLPLSLDEMRPLFENGSAHPLTMKYTLFSTSGNEAKLFKNRLTVDFYEVDYGPRPRDAWVSKIPLAEHLAGLDKIDADDHLLTIQSAKIAAAAGNNSTDYRFGPLISVEGWAIDGNGTSAYKDILLEIGDQLYAPVRSMRADAPPAAEARDSGFMLRTRVPVIRSPQFRIYVLHGDGKTYRVHESAYENPEEGGLITALESPPLEIPVSRYLMGLEKIDVEGPSYWLDASFFAEADHEAGLPAVIHAHGWATDADKVSAYKDIAIEIDGKLYAPGRIRRPDVADAHGSPALNDSGFTLKVTGIPVINPVCRIYIRHRDGKTYRAYESPILPQKERADG